MYDTGGRTDSDFNVDDDGDGMVILAIVMITATTAMTTTAVTARFVQRAVFGTAENGSPTLCLASSADVDCIHVYACEVASGFVNVRLYLRIREKNTLYEEYCRPSVWPLSAIGPFVEFL